MASSTNTLFAESLANMASETPNHYHVGLQIYAQINPNTPPTRYQSILMQFQDSHKTGQEATETDHEAPQTTSRRRKCPKTLQQATSSSVAKCAQIAVRSA